MESGVEEPTECPRCHQVSVTFDYLQGLSVCESCGRVLSADELVSQPLFVEGSRPSGVVLVPGDTGINASAQLLHGSAVGKAIQHFRPTEPLVKLREHLHLLIDKLSLSPATSQEADLYLGQLSKAVGGTWRRELTAAAAAYVAIRQDSLPLTLLDLSDAAHLDVFVLGKYSRMAAEILGIHVRSVETADLLPRLLDRILMGAQLPCANAQLHADAEAMVQWMDLHMVGSRHPTIAAGAAIAFALEMNNVSVGMGHVAKALHVGLDALQNKMHAAREKLLSYAYLLPYNGTIAHKNIGSHARTIVRLTKVLRTEEDSAADILRPLPAPQAHPAQNVKSGEKQRRETEQTERIQNADIARPPEQDGQTVSSSKKRVVRFAKGSENGRTKHQESLPSAATKKDIVYIEPELSDGEIDEYLRSPEEVEMFTKLFELR